MIPPFAATFTDDEIGWVTTQVAEIMRSGTLILGSSTSAFEQAIADLAGASHAIAVNSGSTALEIIFRALEVPGRTVLVPTNTNFATAAAAGYAGAKVKLYDSGLYPDFADIERQLTPDTAAIVVVHIGGYIWPDLPALAARCRELGVALIEDAAHAHGSTLEGIPAGSFGAAAAFSFYPTKVITTGEGGMITTSDRSLEAMARTYRDQGKAGGGMRHVVMGNSWRMTETAAALGLAQMPSFHADTSRRRAVIDRYSETLSSCGLAFPHIPAGSQVSGHKCVAMLPGGISRAVVREAAASAGVQLGRGVYEMPLHRQPVFAQLAAGQGFYRADLFADRHLCLPLWRHMDAPTVDRVIDVVAGVLAGAAA